jgi:hypothetical protein
VGAGAKAVDSELSVLAATAATTVVGLLTTDAWERLKGGLVALWRRANPERAAGIEAEITEARSELLAPGAADDTELTHALVREWQRRIYRLLIADPELAVDLRRLLNEEIDSPRSGAPTPIVHLELNAQASGHGRIYQVGQGEQRNTQP